MPTDYGASSVSDFLRELEGFIDTQCCDVAMVVGDFNVDFDRDGPLAKLLNDFIIELDLSVCDLSFRDKVKFTYERDDGACHSWIDHVLCSQSHSSLITDVFARHSDCCLSDHYPLCFSLDFNSSPLPGPSYKPSKSLHIDWQNASNCDIDKYIKAFPHFLLMFITAFHLAVLSTAILWTCMLITLFLPCSRVLWTHSLLVHSKTNAPV